MRGQRRELIWMFVCLALFGAVLGLLGCVRYTPYLSVYAIPFPPERAEWTAYTDCEAGGQPIVLVNQEAQLHPAMWKYVLVHERQHAEDARTLGCQKVVERIQRDPEFLLWIELRGYCSQYNAMKNDGLLVNPDWQFVGLFTSVWQKYGQQLSEKDLFRKIPCKPTTTDGARPP